MSSLQKRAEACGIALDEKQLSAFERYKELIVEWNDRIDITAITEDAAIEEKHFLDSLSVFRNLPAGRGFRVIDIGTGGGFPGVPMKIYDPSLHMTLFDSLQKRIRFLQEVIEECSLTDTEAIHGRAEEFFHLEAYRDRFDVAVSRAVAPFATLLEYCLPAVRVGGVFLAMKGPAIDEELSVVQPALEALGGRIEQIDSFQWTSERYERNIVVVKKMRPTPKKYPRGQGKPRKSPLILNKQERA
ncbi:MAG: 16S rRNA (guanine(527)-N(7))-methyltransferase RsmG [Ndongobacter sp.]|nr:16S rRNA (guanine(527)-N(7))-methyltransferase RsmG [Ndongobacter sp.]